MQLLSSLSICVGCSSQQGKLKNLQNEYAEFKEIITKSKTPNGRTCIAAGNIAAGSDEVVHGYDY